jgi:hypothetical protein
VVAVVVVLTFAAIDLRSVAAEDGGLEAASADTSEGSLRDDTALTQVAVKVVLSGDVPFVASIEDKDGKKRKLSSPTGEDIEVDRVYEGPPPHVSVGVQAAADGTVRCRIEVDGKRASSSSRSGPYVVTTCLA